MGCAVPETVFYILVHFKIFWATEFVSGF